MNPRRPFAFHALFLVALLLALGASARAGDDSLTLWFQKPASDAKPMNEALAVGDGHLGGLIFGAPERERVCLNEDSLWTGDDNPSSAYETMGAYQVLGNLFINLPAHGHATDYRRDLDFATAQAHVSYTAGGVKYRREVFCSHPTGVLAMRLSADRPGAYTGSIELDDSHRAAVAVSGNRLTVSGALDNAMKYDWQVLALHEGGTLQASGTTLEFKDCDSLTLYVAAGTDYMMDAAKAYRGGPPHGRVTAQLDAAGRIPYDTLKAESVKDYLSLFDRASIDLGHSSPAQTALPTDQRKLAASQSVDPELEALLFQYGRYLLISCSRPGGLPANLQGLWNDSNNPPWHCDYHSNINIQMNYWPAEVANLSECHLPFFDLIRSQLAPWRKATAASRDFETASGEMTRRGFAIRTSHNITGGMGWKWDKTANAWYCHHLWEHYAFGGDKEFLRAVAYPILKETCEFWEDHLKALPDGRLVVPNAWSPEHGPTEDGVSYAQEIVWDLFTNYLDACDALDIDHDDRARVAAMRDKLAVPGVGGWGQLLEWMTEKKNNGELDTPDDHHRHTSHLFAVYPGRQISMEKTPELARAAKVSLDARGPTGDVREWSYAWRTALYARLHDGEDAHRMLQQLFSKANTSPNLFGLHPPVQLDGNFGITAAIAEMLVQSQTGEIDLLPALPGAWPNGSVKGLRARGGFEIDLQWHAGRLTGAVVRSTLGQPCRVRCEGGTVDLKLPAGGSQRLGVGLKISND